MPSPLARVVLVLGVALGCGCAGPQPAEPNAGPAQAMAEPQAAAPREVAEAEKAAPPQEPESTQAPAKPAPAARPQQPAPQEPTAKAEPSPEAQPEKPPEPTPPWEAMDYGPFLSATIDCAEPEGNCAVKGIAVRLDGGRAGMLFDTELMRMAAGWDGELVLHNVSYDGAHGPFTKVPGSPAFATGVRPGWSIDGRFDDPRATPHGALPNDLAHYRALHRHGEQVIFAYTVAGCDVLESPGLESAQPRVFRRTFHLAPHDQPLQVLVAEMPGASATVAGQTALLDRGGADPERHVTGARWVSAPAIDAQWQSVGDGLLALELPPSDVAVRLKITPFGVPASELSRVDEGDLAAPADLTALLDGGPRLWDQDVVTHGSLDSGDGAWVVDTLTVPYDNPWQSWMRIAALDFFSNGDAAVSTWNGDVWVVSGIDDDLDELHWRRFATGLFDPLGLKIVDDVVHTLGRDGITKLVDTNDDGEADDYEAFNRDVLVSRSFHEFAFDLQTDPDGNFYFSKAGPVLPGGRGFDPILPHHGCVLKVTPDGKTLSVYATGLRAPNGIGVGPDGQVTTGDNEGTWTPRCRLNWVREGSFLGCVDTGHRDPPPDHFDPPLCFFPMEVDNSSGGQVWVTSDRWGPLQGELLHLSYGTCSLFHVLRQNVDGVMQGGVVRFPLSFGSSCMRARFHPNDGQLYVVGLKGWQTSAALPSALQRVRYTGQPTHMPVALAVTPTGVRIEFADALDPELAQDPESWSIERWNYVWSDHYGSPEVTTTDLEQDLEAAKADWNGFKHHETVKVVAAVLEPDEHTVSLTLDPVTPIMQQRIRYDLDTKDGAPLRGEILHTINRVPGEGPGSGSR